MSIEQMINQAWAAPGVDKYANSPKSVAQREAGNYKMRHVRIHGLDISIETGKGERRRPEWPPMPCDYGYIKRTRGNDGDHVDVFLAVSTRSRTFSDLVVVIDQVSQDGKFDEHKVVLGATSVADAVDCYKKAYAKGWKVGPVTAMTIEQFKNWLKTGTQRKPVKPQVSKYCQQYYSLAASNDDLVLSDDAPLSVDRYWKSQPRAPEGRPSGGQWVKGGNAEGSSEGGRDFVKAQLVKKGGAAGQKRELASLPDTIKPGHALHHSSLPEKWQNRLLQWNGDMSQLMRGIGMRGHGASLAGTDREAAEEKAWQEVDKDRVRGLLDQMNQWNREAQGDGVAFHEFVNANGIIPRQLATRLGSGRKFFDPEHLGSKLKGQGEIREKAPHTKPKVDSAKLKQWKDASDGEKRKLKSNPDMASAIAAAMGVSPHTTPTAAEPNQSSPQRQPIKGLTRAADSKLRNELEGQFGISNPEHQNQLGNMVADVWKNLARETDDRNDALRQLTGHFGKGLGATVANIRNGVDTDRIAGFDELVDHAANEYPHLVSRIAGESDTGSHEESLAEAIRTGIQKTPQPWSPEVLDRVKQVAGPFVFDPQAMEVASALSNVVSDEPIPFAAKSDLARAVERYWARSLLPR